MLRDCCSNTVKAAAIIGCAIIVAVAMWLYFNPYQSCVRWHQGEGFDGAVAARVCLHGPG